TKLEQLDQIQQEHKTLEISKITGENGVADDKHNSFMDKFLSGVGLGGFTQNSSKPAQPAKNSAPSGTAVSPGTPDKGDSFTPPPKTLSLEEKQRLAKQQDQERMLKSQKNLVPRPLSTHATSSPSAPTTPVGGSGGVLGGGGGMGGGGTPGSSGPRDLTSTLMASNMRNLSMASKANSVSNIPAGGGGSQLTTARQE
ncbi:hypothetical protein EGW08_006736, partial [Elysia chlorotica]